ncbi:SOS response-associated peptidase [Barrientosiimonas marina]|uniref:Abasic site processing protein n=1 Tax=Lentibacillus kimchii TaxID=1542911 RepID=A0ABW2USA7_9BACI
MCGRYTLLADEKQIAQTFGLDQPIDLNQPRYNVAPGQNVLAIIHDGQKKRAGYLRWGLIPSWAKDEKIGYKMINARSETAHEKPSFKHLLSRKRCLIPADSFYEWNRDSQEKQPKRIQLQDRRLFAFAGLWDKWEQNGQKHFTCTILTREANAFMQPIHHRMPIILSKEQMNAWLEAGEQKPEDVHRFLSTLEPEDLQAYDVASYVNSVKNDDETCIAPLV